MATFPIDHEASMGFGPRPPTDMPNPMEETASEQRLWAALWLYPEISSLTRSLVGKLKDAWDYDSAFLLEEILEFQIIYKEYQEANVGPVAFFLGDGALLTSADVMGIARTVSTNLIKYQINDIYQLVGRELQMKVFSPNGYLRRVSQHQWLLEHRANVHGFSWYLGVRLIDFARTSAGSAIAHPKRTPTDQRRATGTTREKLQDSCSGEKEWRHHP